MVAGPRSQTQWLLAQFREQLIVKERATLGPRPTDHKTIKMLHRVIHWRGASDGKPTAIEYSADPRHAEVLFAHMGFSRSTVPKGSGFKGLNATRGVTTQFVKENVTEAKLKVVTDAEEVARFRSACMRLAFLAMDRPELQYPSKECARGIAGPTVRHFDLLKRAVQFLLHAPTCTWIFEQEKWPGLCRLFSDSDWAGCPVTKKSTSGLTVMFGKHCWYTSASTQQAISTSSGEAEYYALAKAGSRAIQGINGRSWLPYPRAS